MAGEIQRMRVDSAIRTLRPEDAAAVSVILRSAPEAVFWPEASVKEVLEWQGTLAIVSEVDRQVAGFLIGRQAGGEAEILNLAIAPGNRRKGEGGALLKSAVQTFRMRGVSRVFLEVRESNGVAIAFYLKHGFSKTGRRDGYYRDPHEAAIVMEKRLTG